MTTKAFVVTIGDIPLVVAMDLEAAQTDGLTQRARYGSRSEYDYRWDEHRPGKVWRLMQRRKGPAGKGRRFSWTQYAVHAVDIVGGGE